MPRNGSGSFSLAQASFVAGTTISSASMNSDLSDIAAALTGSLPRDGQAGMTGQFKLPDGSPAAPALSFNNEPNTGFTRPGTGQVGLVILGVQVATFGSSGITGSFQGASPAGTIVSFAGSTAPAGWLLCFGQAVSRAANAALFTAIGVIYGSGDGSTTFNVPDCRGYALVGKGDMGGSDAGRLTTAFYGTSPVVLGNPGGGQSRSLITGNLPAYTPSGAIGISDPSHIHNVPSGCSNGSSTGGGGFACGITTNVNTLAALTGITSSFFGNAQGGASTAFPLVQPSLIVNKIIYTGG